MIKIKSISIEDNTNRYPNEEQVYNKHLSKITRRGRKLTWQLK